jgi:uncharacterized protein with HEPN domain
LPFKDSETHFRDLLDGIKLIEEFVAGMDLADYEADVKTRSAVERQLQIITEAAYRLGDEADILCPGPDWKGFMGMGNILRHAYHRERPDRLAHHPIRPTQSQGCHSQPTGAD